MTYVDGYVLPIPVKNLKAYAVIAKKASKVWKDHGALSYCESVGEDLTPQFGIPFPKAIALKRGETMVFSFVTFKSRKHRDAVNKKVMQDPRLTDMMDPKKMPFDCSRMVYGGFDALVAF